MNKMDLQFTTPLYTNKISIPQHEPPLFIYSAFKWVLGLYQGEYSSIEYSDQSEANSNFSSVLNSVF